MAVSQVDGYVFTVGSLMYGSQDAVIVRTNADLTSQLWYHWGTGTQIDQFRSVVVDPFGNYIYTAGYTKSFGSNTQDPFILKATKDLVKEWVYVFVANTYDDIFADMKMDRWGRFIYMSGYTDNPNR